MFRMSILNEKMKNKKHPEFILKPVSKATITKALKKIKKKKSSGSDGLTQEKLVEGAETLTEPLRIIINKSINKGRRY